MFDQRALGRIIDQFAHSLTIYLVRGIVDDVIKWSELGEQSTFSLLQTRLFFLQLRYHWRCLNVSAMVGNNLAVANLTAGQSGIRSAATENSDSETAADLPILIRSKFAWNVWICSACQIIKKNDASNVHRCDKSLLEQIRRRQVAVIEKISQRVLLCWPWMYKNACSITKIMPKTTSTSRSFQIQGAWEWSALLVLRVTKIKILGEWKEQV